MQRRNEYQAQVAEFWRAVEMLNPQPVPKVRPPEPVFPGYAELPLPWESDHEIHEVPLAAGMTWRHIVYGGIFPLRRARELLARAFGEEAESLDAREPGDSALLAITVTDDGRPLLGSQELSSCAWVAGRTGDDALPGAPDWWDGFVQSSAACDREIKRLLAASDDDHEAAEVNARLKRGGIQVGGPIGHRQLTALCDRVAAEFGVADVLRPDGIRIRSVPVAKDARYGDTADVLNSVTMGDLTRVAPAARDGNYGAALDAYLGGTKSTARDRIDLRKDLGTVYEGVAPELVSAARWPAESDRALSLGQQFAINTALADLAPGAGLFSVNGPPGTGKTTMVQDLVAAVVVERARRLAALPATYAAFGTTLRWQTGEDTRVVSTWKTQLTGFEMVLAAPDEAGAESTPYELSRRSGIAAEWHESADYFAELATQVLAAAAWDPAIEESGLDGAADPANWPDPPGSSEPSDALEDTESPWPYVAEEPGEEAWGLVAARLDNARSRQRFVNAFWLPDPATGAPGMRDILADAQPKPAAWREAVRDFRKAERAATELMNKRAKVFGQVTTLPHAERERGALEQEQRRARQVVTDIEGRIADAARPMTDLSQAAADRERERRAHLEHRPVGVGKLFGRNRLREWRHRDEELAAAVAQAEQRLRASEGTLTHLHDMHASAQSEAEEHQDRLATLTDQVASAQAAIRRARGELADALPVADWWDNEERRELSAPWTDAAWNAARTRLFLAALKLHRAFLAAEADRMRKNLQAAMDVLRGAVPAKASRQAVLAAWQSLFFVVPLVSTTFASCDRVFAPLDREALGWLFVDEAGQVAAQQAVGAIWRAQRAVFIGDPLHLEPTVPVPLPAQQAVRQQFRLSEAWLPGRISAQRLADQANRYGTLRSTRDGRVWVGAPLRVHRRCDGPMFGIANAVAYGGRMISAVTSRDPIQPEGFPAPPDSKWIDIPMGMADGHWIPEEGEELRFVLRRLRKQCGITSDRVIVITPFRQVANRLEGIAEDFPGLKAGTVHAAQGRKADIVIFILGGDPKVEDAKEWAAAKPNLVNVAVSSAQHRLYVIGNHGAWSTHRYFDALAAGLPVTSSIRPVQDFVDLEPGTAAETS